MGHSTDTPSRSPDSPWGKSTFTADISTLRVPCRVVSGSFALLSFLQLGLLLGLLLLVLSLEDLQAESFEVLFAAPLEG